MTPSVLTLLVALQWPPVPMPGGDEFPPGRQWADVLAAPPESDLWRFPPRAACTQARRFNARFRANLEAERELYPPQQQGRFAAALSDAAGLYAAWDKLDDLHTLGQAAPWWRRRLMLAELRTLIGPDAYGRGEMPPWVPSWWCREKR